MDIKCTTQTKMALKYGLTPCSLPWIWTRNRKRTLEEEAHTQHRAEWKEEGDQMGMSIQLAAELISSLFLEPHSLLSPHQSKSFAWSSWHFLAVLDEVEGRQTTRILPPQNTVTTLHHKKYLSIICLQQHNETQQQSIKKKNLHYSNCKHLMVKIIHITQVRAPSAICWLLGLREQPGT